jgi:hypothetical protein
VATDGEAHPTELAEDAPLESTSIRCTGAPDEGRPVRTQQLVYMLVLATSMLR